VRRLLDLAFLVHDVLAHYRIVFLHFQFVRRRALVLVSRIEVPGAGTGIHANFFSHTFSLITLPISLFVANCADAFSAAFSAAFAIAFLSLSLPVDRHYPPQEADSDLLAARPHFVKHRINAFLVDDTHALAGHFQSYESLFRFHPEAVLVQIGQEPTAGAVLGVGYVVSGDRTLSGYLTDSGHDILAWPGLGERQIARGGC
jgi:hypothetical protein